METQYRNNYIPARELSGGILQIQKYIYYIHHLGKKMRKSFQENIKIKLRRRRVKNYLFH